MDVNQVYTTLASNGLTDDHTVGCLNYTPGTSTSNTFLSWIHPASYVKRTIFHSNTASSAAFVAAYAGVVVQTNVADNLAWHTIRFIRRYLGVQFPIVGVTP
jgi:hypothetical protein